jgi:hypothetical protein
MLDIRPQLEHVIRKEREVVKTGMKNTVNFVDRSSRWWCAKAWQYWQLAGRPGNSFVMVLNPKSRNIVDAFRGWLGTASKLTYQFTLAWAG